MGIVWIRSRRMMMRIKGGSFMVRVCRICGLGFMDTVKVSSASLDEVKTVSLSLDILSPYNLNQIHDFH